MSLLVILTFSLALAALSILSIIVHNIKHSGPIYLPHSVLIFIIEQPFACVSETRSIHHLQQYTWYVTRQLFHYVLYMSKQKLLKECTFLKDNNNASKVFFSNKLVSKLLSTVYFLTKIALKNEHLLAKSCFCTYWCSWIWYGWLSIYVKSGFGFSRT